MQQKTITSWSFSRYLDYKTCPLKAKLKYLDKVKEPGNQAMARGNAIHVLAADFINGKYKKRTFPVELVLFKDLFNELRKMYKKSKLTVFVEDTFAFTKTWGITTYDDWKNCWLRVKVDVGFDIRDGVFSITDWKTGKMHDRLIDDYEEQLELYALAALMRLPDIEKVETSLKYLDIGETYPQEPIVFERRDIPRLKKLWEKRTKKMLVDKVFKPTPHDKCKWCWFGQAGKAKGGPGICKF